MQQLWLVSIPNNKESPEVAISNLKNTIAATGEGRIYKFDIPELVVGTLDSLIALSDELSKINSQVENVVRKVERQYVEISTGSEREPLRVNETSIDKYLHRFQWDFARFQHQGKPLSELVGQIQSLAAKVDDELKQLTTTYTEKNLAVTATQRKKTINLVTSDLEDFLTPEDVARLDMLDTESLLTVLIVVPKSLDSEFLATYSQLGPKIAAYGGPDWTNSSSIGQDDGKFGAGAKRTSVKGSPVVPNSKKKVAEEGDSVMYAVTILKGHYKAGGFVDDVFTPGTFVDYLDPFKTVCREKRFIVRDFSFDSTKTGGIEGQIAEAKKEMKQVKATTMRWCKANFGEVFSAWIHLKAIRAFVESVLRYGLPVDFLSFLFEPSGKAEKDLQNQMTTTLLGMRPQLQVKRALVGDEDEEGSADTDNLPYVCHKFGVVGTVAIA